jgi:hypothetical protein
MIYSDFSSVFFAEENGTYVVLDCEFGVTDSTVSIVPKAPRDRWDEAERLALLSASYDQFH